MKDLDQLMELCPPRLNRDSWAEMLRILDLNGRLAAAPRDRPEKAQRPSRNPPIACDACGGIIERPRKGQHFCAAACRDKKRWKEYRERWLTRKSPYVRSVLEKIQ